MRRIVDGEINVGGISAHLGNVVHFVHDFVHLHVHFEGSVLLFQPLGIIERTCLLSSSMFEIINVS